MTSQSFDLAIAFGAVGYWMLRGLMKGGIVSPLVWTDFTHIDTAMMLRGAREPWRVNQMLEIARVWSCEAWAARNSSLTTACTVSDQNRIQHWFRAGAPALLENPILDPMYPESGVPVPYEPGEEILITGDLGHDSNAEGLNWFVEECLPALRARGRRHPITVAGRSPLASIGRTLDIADGRLIADPDGDEMEQIWRRAAVALVPLRRASGSRIRILEAARRGVPIVSTSRGAEGLDPRNLPLLHIADSPEDFAREVEWAIARPPSSKDREESLSWIEQHHTLGAFSLTLDKLLTEAL